MLLLMSVDLYFTLALLFYPLLNNSSSDDAGPLSVTHLHIREIGHPYVILKRFPCGKKIQTSITFHQETVYPPVEQDILLLRIIQTFPFLAVEEFLLNLSPKRKVRRFTVFFFPQD